MDIYLIRHTTPLVEQGICYGQTDLDLAESFDEEFRILKTKIPQAFDAVYSSPLKRCHNLAKRLNTKEFTFSDKIKELNFGDWEMIKWDEINPESLKHWSENFVHTSPPNGETFHELSQRTSEFFSELLKTVHQCVAVVAHGGPIRTMVANVLGLPLSESVKLQFDFGKVSLVKIDDQTKKVGFVNR